MASHLLLLLLAVALLTSVPADGRGPSRVLRQEATAPNKQRSTGANPVPNCFMVLTESAHGDMPASHSRSRLRSRAQRRLLGAAAAEHSARVVARAKAVIGDEAVTGHKSLGPVFPGFHVSTRHDEDAAALIRFLQEEPEVRAYWPCASVSQPKLPQPSSIGPVVGPPPLSAWGPNGVYESSDGAAVRSLPGYESLYGQGVKVAIVDTGVDYLHPGLGGCFGPGCKVASGFDFVGDFGGDPGLLPLDCSNNDHGTMVAGVVAGNYTLRYNSTANVTFLGIAPGVTLLAYRIFSCYFPGTTDALIAEAVQKAYEEGADVINLSLGTDGQWEDAWTVLTARLAQLGIVVVRAEGNAATEGLFMGSEVPPSDSTHPIPIISVGSTDDPRIQGNMVLSIGSTAILPSTFGAYGTFANITFPNLDALLHAPLRLTANAALGLNMTADACDGTMIGNLTGATALILRGTCSFAEKVANVLAAGASGVLIWNRLPEALGAIAVGADVTAPVLTMSGTTGTSLASLVNRTAQAGGPPLMITGYRFIATGVSSFSSWGPAPDLRITPDLSAPGGNIFTLSHWSDLTQPAPCTVVSGTSFSSPYVAGAIALYLQAARALGLDPTPAQVRDALATTAQPIQSIDPETGRVLYHYESPLRAGAGRINLTAAILSLPPAASASPSPSATLFPTTLLLPTGLAVVRASFNLSNPSPSATLTYALTHIPTDSIYAYNAMTIAYNVLQSPPQYMGVPYVPQISPDGGLAVTFSNSSGVRVSPTTGAVTVTVRPRAMVKVQVSFSVPQPLRFRGYLVAGYLIATPTATTGVAPSGPTLTLPYLGYTSNFSSLPILKPDVPGGLALPATTVAAYLPELYPGELQIGDAAILTSTSSAPYPVLVNATGGLVPPYDTQLANWTANGTLPVYPNDLIASSMPVIYLNLQHQFVSFDLYLVGVDPATRKVLNNVSFLMGSSGPNRSATRNADPTPYQLPTQYYDAESGYLLPIPDGSYAARFVMRRADAVADAAAGRARAATEVWTSPPFTLATRGR